MAAINALFLIYVWPGFTNAMTVYNTSTQGINSIKELKNLEDKADE
jgi:hypothetical protein